MRINRPTPAPRTHEGAPAAHINSMQQLKRSVLACMLWEKGFYEEGEEIAARIKRLVAQCDPIEVGLLAVDAREQYKLRHVPLWIVYSMTCAGGKHRQYAGTVLAEVIQRADELSEYLAIHWQNGRTPLPSSIKRGLAKACTKFNAYQLAKYDRTGSVKLRDVFRLVHPKPRDESQSKTWRQLIAGELASPDTWEVALSKGGTKSDEEKKNIWTRLLTEQKLGAMALLRNLRNMQQCGVSEKLIEAALREAKTDRVLPFRFIAAAKAAPRLEPVLEPLMLRCLEGRSKLPGHTVLLVDHSGSMNWGISGRGQQTHFDAACGLAILAREMCEKVTVLAFSNQCWEVPPRRGFALRDALHQGAWGGTYLGAAINAAVTERPSDRLIVFTDEQSHDRVPAVSIKGYMVNVANNRNGVSYGNGWQHIDGFSEAILDYINNAE